MLAKWPLFVAVLFLATTSSALAAPPAKKNSNFFEFVGYSSATVQGDVGFVGMHAACQAEFGALVRFCTSKEFVLTPIQETPTVAAWVHPVISFMPFISHSGTFGDFARTGCGFWDENGTESFGLVVNTDGVVAIRDSGGAFITCNVDRPVTCCTPVQ